MVSNLHTGWGDILPWFLVRSGEKLGARAIAGLFHTPPAVPEFKDFTDTIFVVMGHVMATIFTHGSITHASNFSRI
jgi:hypothetical protein